MTITGFDPDRCPWGLHERWGWSWCELEPGHDGPHQAIAIPPDGGGPWLTRWGDVPRLSPPERLPLGPSATRAQRITRAAVAALWRRLPRSWRARLQADALPGPATVLAPEPPAPPPRR